MADRKKQTSARPVKSAVEPTVVAAAKPAAEPPTRRRLDAPGREEALLDAAEKVISEDGMHALTMDRVAKRAGVSRGLVYLHFRNRAELLMRMLEREDAAASAWITQLHREAVDFEDEIRLSTRSYFAGAYERTALLHHVRHERSLEESVEPRRRASRAMDIGYWAEGAMADGLTPERAQVFATAFVGAAESCWDLIFTQSLPSDVMEETFVASALAALRELRSLSAADRRRRRSRTKPPAKAIAVPPAGTPTRARRTTRN